MIKKKVKSKKQKLDKTNEITAAVIVSGVIARKEEDADDQDVSETFGGKRTKTNDTKLAEAGMIAQHYAGKRRTRRLRIRQRRQTQLNVSKRRN